VLAFSPNGKTLFTGCSEDHTGGLWSADTGKRLHRLVADGKGDRGDPLAAAFTPDGRHVVVGYGVPRATNTGKDWPARVWAVADGKLVREFGGHTDGVHQLAVSADGKQLATRDWGEAVRVWDLGTGELARQVVWGPTHGPAAMAFPRPDAVIAAIHDHRVTATVVSDLIANKALVQQPGGSASAPALSPDGRLVAVVGGPGGGVAIVETATGGVVRTLAGTGPLMVVALSPDGGTVAKTERLGGLGGEFVVHLFDVKTGEKVRTLRGHLGMVAGLAFSPDGKRLATGGWDSTALVWDVAQPGK
jgi:WD40 repeat protein